ncbi:sensor histidine kinase [Hahella ganghwensis]|uniref:sensor histidine kinase n=1 Tax=Hahella ganghwensis TaxID=286420 RepID=UPI00035C28BB|nr:HAMP domain-containing sensor histidine kinase [Hahella ganghwensis]
MAPQSPRKGIQSRLIRVFAVQATLVSLATALGVYAAYKIAEDILVREALTGEAEHYWQLVDQHGDYPLPNTRNMQGFRASLGELEHLPQELRVLEPGFGRHPFHGKTPLVLISEKDGERLYLIFKEEQVTRLALFFGVAPLTVVLILIYLASWFTFRQSQRVISPVVQLAKVVEDSRIPDTETLASDLRPFHAVDADIDALATSIEHFAARLQLFIERERTFTRDASHELRTPLAVLKGSMDVLEQMESFSSRGQGVLVRMRKTVQDMEGLIETLLLMAREEDNQQDSTPILLNDLVPTIISQTQHALGVAEDTVTFEQHTLLEVSAPSKVLTILLTNLLRNAIRHGIPAGEKPGGVTVIIEDQTIAVKDTGQGMDEEQMRQAFQPFYRGTADGEGHGLGLAIVKRICQRFAWELKAHSGVGKGTKVTIEFPQGKIVGRQ